MKSNIPILYPNDKVSQSVTQYAETHTTPLPRHILDYHQHIQDTMPDTANYMVSPYQAQSMAWIAKLIGAKRSEFRLPRLERGRVEKRKAKKQKEEAAECRER